jgi:hypothetical protein
MSWICSALHEIISSWAVVFLEILPMLPRSEFELQLFGWHLSEQRDATNYTLRFETASVLQSIINLLHNSLTPRHLASVISGVPQKPSIPIYRHQCHKFLAFQETTYDVWIILLKHAFNICLFIGITDISLIWWSFMYSVMNNASVLDLYLSQQAKVLSGRRPRAICHIVWSISTCPSLTRWDVEFAFHGSISPQCPAFGKLNRSNWIWVCRFLENYFSILDVKICQRSVYDGIWSESDHPIYLERRNRLRQNYHQTSGTVCWACVQT